MEFNLAKSIEILERSPKVFNSLLQNLPEHWTKSNEGPDTFSPYDVIGHLIHGEKTDWRPRTMLILKNDIPEPFIPYDRFAQFENSKGKSLQVLLDEFEKLRAENMTWLKSLKITDNDLEKKGIHPSLGPVTLKQLLSTWVVHDLTHIAQVTRVMAKQYKEETGPWAEYFRILNF
ncbi:MAG: DinB family protein [Chitinophagaceae bacterium]